MATRPLLSAVLLIALLLAPPSARADCPANHGSCVTPTTAPIGGTNTLCPELGRASVAYDLIRGTIHLTLNDPGLTGAATDLYTADIFTFTGLPPGTPVTFTLELVVQGSLAASPFDGSFGGEAGASFSAHLDGEPSIAIEKFIQSSYLDPGGKVLSVDESVVQVATRNAGQPFTLSCYANTAGIGGSANLTGRYRFHDLPPGVTVTSCQGYLLPDYTPNSATSWGRVKIRYR